jgi:hypothetical protein
MFYLGNIKNIKFIFLKGQSKWPIVRGKKKKKNIELGDVHIVGCTPTTN